MMAKGRIIMLNGVSALHDHPVLWVRVDCPSHELRRREAERGNRNIGQGEMQLEDLEPQTLYDVTVGTCANTTTACVSLIQQKLAAPDGVPVIRQLWLEGNN